MFTIALLANLLLASAALAAPNGRLGDRLARRNGGARQGKPLVPSNGPAGRASNATHADYSSNWTGAVLIATKATYKTVTGTFTVPTPKSPGGSGSYSASAWVGIDGDTYGNSILQTGLDFTISGGKVSYDAWYEWYPDYAYDFSGISFSAGDSVQLTVTATSTKAGTAVIKNLSTGKSVTKSLSSSAALGELNAEWIVEDYEEGSSLVPLANWGTVTFTNISPSASGADLITLEQNSKILSSVSATSSSVTVTYV